MLSQIRHAVCGEHCKSIETDNVKRVQISANPLNECSSLDAPLAADDAGSSTKGETIEDPAASQAFQSAEDEIYTEELHAALEEALGKLKDREADVLRRRYYEGKPLRAVGEEIGVQSERVRQIEAGAFRKLKNDSQLARWHEEIITTRAWRGTGFGSWKRYGSVQERSVEYWDEQVKKYEEHVRELVEKYGISAII